MIKPIEIPKGKVSYFHHRTHEPYWSQFPDLKHQLGRYADQLKAKLEAFGEAEIIDGGMVDTARRLGRWEIISAPRALASLLCYVTTYATGAVLFATNNYLRNPGADVVLLGLQLTLVWLATQFPPPTIKLCR